MSETQAVNPMPKATLADLEPAEILLGIVLADDSEVSLNLRLIPQFRMMEIAALVPMPQAPIKEYASGGRPIYDFDEPTYKAAAEKAMFKRNCYFIAEMAQIDIPGETLEAKADYIRDKFDPLVTEQIVFALNMQREKVKARIISRAATFRR